MTMDKECCEGMDHDEACGCEDQALITMIDAETGEEYTFAIVDDFLSRRMHTVF